MTETTKLRELCENATPGPWFTTSDTCIIYAELGSRAESHIADAFDGTPWSDAQCQHNARFLAASRTALPALLDEMARLTEGLSKSNANHETFERRWYLAQDEVDNLEAKLVTAQQMNGAWAESAAASLREVDDLKAKLVEMTAARDNACELAEQCDDLSDAGRIEAAGLRRVGKVSP